jgi:hypothetical protein
MILRKKSPSFGTTFVQMLILFINLTRCLGVLQLVIDSIVVFLGALQSTFCEFGGYDQTLFFDLAC